MVKMMMMLMVVMMLEKRWGVVAMVVGKKRVV
jgi:hypothetical protein